MILSKSLSKHLAVCVAAASLVALTACATGPSKDDLEARGRQACLDAADEQIAKSNNMPTAAHDPNASFQLNRAEGHETEGTMSWNTTIYTSKGIPWEHWAQCIADVSTDPAKVTYLKIDLKH